MSEKKMRKFEKVGDGNTKTSPTRKAQPSQLKSWFFTFNNFEKDDIEILKKKFQEICVKYCFQEEVGKEGTRHLQGNIWLKKAMRYTQFELSSKIHWEKTRNDEAAFRYCTKRETAIGEPYVWGFPKPIRIITDLYPWQKNIEDLFFTEATDRGKIHW